MKNLLEFYEESVKLGPDIPNHIEIVVDYTEKVKKFDSIPYIPILKNIYLRTLPDISNYCGSRIDYFESINGNKVVMCKDYIGIIDLWFPSERPLFDLTSPILSGWLVSEIICAGGLTGIEEIIQYPSLLDQALENLKKTLIGTTIWGFWLGDQRRGIRKRGIRIRELEIKEVRVPVSGGYYGIYPLETILYDKRERVNLRFESNEHYSGWNFYLSKELLKTKLEELEILWTRGYDDRVRSFDFEIKKKTKELENLKDERNKYENGIEEFRKKIHEKLWKSF
jgi:hypothetical protein